MISEPRALDPFFFFSHDENSDDQRNNLTASADSSESIQSAASMSNGDSSPRIPTCNSQFIGSMGRTISNGHNL